MCTRVFFFYFVTFTRLLQPRTSVYLDPPPESVNSREGIRPRQIFQTLSQNSLAGNVGFLVCVRLLVEIARKACGSRPKNKIADDPCESLLRIDVLTSFSNNYRFNVAHRSPTAAIERGKTKKEREKERKETESRIEAKRARERALASENENNSSHKRKKNRGFIVDKKKNEEKTKIGKEREREIARE